jgi:uncharacterized membrane protein YgcG
VNRRRHVGRRAPRSAFDRPAPDEWLDDQSAVTNAGGDLLRVAWSREGVRISVGAELVATLTPDGAEALIEALRAELRYREETR